MSHHFNPMSHRVKENTLFGIPDQNKQLSQNIPDRSYANYSTQIVSKMEEGQEQDPDSIWTLEEENTLMNLAKRTKPVKSWKKIAENFSGKNELQCQSHYEALNESETHEKYKKKPWTEEEDAIVMQLVEKHGPQRWTFIADHLPGRVGKQCRERWHNHLNPKIKKSAWTDEEEWVLFLSHKAIGSRWAEIAKYIPGRTDNSIKNHWNSSMKKRIPELLVRFMKIRENGGLGNYIETANVSEMEYKLLKKLLSVDEDEYRLKSENMLESRKVKTSKPIKVYREKETGQENLQDFKLYNPINKIEETQVKLMSDTATPPSNNMVDNLKKLQDNIINNKDPRVFENICNIVKMKLDFSMQGMGARHPDHLTMIDQMYTPQHFQALFHNNQPSFMPGEFNFKQTHFDDENVRSYLRDPSSLLIKKEHEYPLLPQPQISTFLSQDFGVPAPFMKFEPRIYENRQYENESCYEHFYTNQNDENKNKSNLAKAENLREVDYFDSPPTRKKVKGNTTIAANMLYNDLDKVKVIKYGIIINYRTNKINVNGQSQMFPAYNLFSHDSPSKMMQKNDRTQGNYSDNTDKPIFQAFSNEEKSPLSLMNKRTAI